MVCLAGNIPKALTIAISSGLSQKGPRNRHFRRMIQRTRGKMDSEMKALMVGMYDVSWCELVGFGARELSEIMTEHVRLLNYD